MTKDKLNIILKEYEHHLHNAQEGLTRSEAESQILSLIRSCKPKKRELLDTTCECEMCASEYSENMGFNSACDLMDKNIADCMKGTG